MNKDDVTHFELQFNVALRWVGNDAAKPVSYKKNIKSVFHIYWYSIFYVPLFFFSLGIHKEILW